MWLARTVSKLADDGLTMTDIAQKVGLTEEAFNSELETASDELIDRLCETFELGSLVLVRLDDCVADKQLLWVYKHSMDSDASKKLENVSRSINLEHIRNEFIPEEFQEIPF